ncbi:MAG: glycine cleavage system aminomethyltransferase GcvT [Planctomycetes bacterium]|nr:glycine cleavage system aminomethyltransferase GcvT [Planctomycetota bacterium]
MNRTPLHDKHCALGARMIDFGGWDMPVTYADIATEHAAVRSRAGLFDLCHMGRVSVHGPDAEKLVQRAQTNDLDRIGMNQIRYAMLLHDHGGVIDDILVHRRDRDVFLVVNASNRERDLARLRELGQGLNAQVDDLSDEMAMIAIQGPASAAIAARLVDDIDIAGLGYYRLAEGRIMGQPSMVTRTGYTGEDGFEFYVPKSIVASLWDAALEAGQPEGLIACGLGARDTLRLEAGMPLYGHEITDDINPVEAGLMFGVRLKKDDYPGREVLTRVKAEGPARQLVGLVVEGRRIPREGYAVMLGEARVGHVASGTWSPSFETGIATALVDSKALAKAEAHGLEVDIRGRRASARIVSLPFYKRDGTGSLNQS